MRMAAISARSLRVRSEYLSGGYVRVWRRAWWRMVLASVPALVVPVLLVRTEVPARLVPALLVPLLVVSALLAEASIWALVYMFLRSPWCYGSLSKFTRM